MENASKALIIAGAILIAILLIAISMYIYNSAQGTVSSAASNMSANEKTMFNQAISQYQGSNVAGANVKSLIDQVITTNQGHVGEAGIFVSITPTEFSAQLNHNDGDEIGEAGTVENNADYVNEYAQIMTSLKTDVNTGKRYTVETTIGDTGLINNVSIKEN